MKVDVEYLEYMWPMRHFLITCGDISDKANIIPLSFVMPVSRQPPLIAIAVGRTAYSLELILQTGEFVVNVPARDLEKAVYYCGYNSGRDIDKFTETGLTPEPARSIRPPIISECAAHMECKVVNEIETGDKYTFIGEVIEAYADEEIAEGKRDLEYAKGEFPRIIYGTRFMKGK
ncbi:flavin reductase family protein [candidate division WOR-3 bacterium]|uniref:Flavin reductase family protein n=1 Tax=candidate division WOR-3 bacterium TaxID=2052148 RepID=A0A9D5QC56_UNCW3|nr:flavin reductase family protein [candidate division WOR-3 bacterium]MBD3364318.1 flavin reductase family protein [candidate division WOR-3 bacterium]